MNKIPVIMDVDTGVDDAMAIILALSSDNINLLGITTVAGNVEIEHTTRNTLSILELLNFEDIPVGRGASKPIYRKLSPATLTHGNTGLGNAKLDEPKIKVNRLDAVGLLKKLIEESEEKVTLVPVGPLTNIAILLRCYPHLKDNIEQIVIMGGGAYRGNRSPTAEFNIWIDPEAAHIVFQAGIPIVMAGLDITMEALALEEDIENFRELNTPVGNFCVSAFEVYMAHYKSYYKDIDIAGCAVHDAVAIAYLINPEIMKGRMANVKIDIDGENTLGATAVDFNPYNKKDFVFNAKVLTEINREKFIEILFNAVKSYK